MRNLLRAPYGMRFLQLSLALGYFLSAWTKSRGTTWHDGTAIALSLRIEDLQRFVAPEWLFEQAVLLNLFTWATLAFEATFCVLVWNRRLRPWVIGIGVAFHLGIDLFLDIGFFSIAIYLAYLAFLPDEVANRLVGRFDTRALEAEPADEERARRAGSWRGAWGAEAPPEPPTREGPAPPDPTSGERGRRPHLQLGGARRRRATRTRLTRSSQPRRTAMARGSWRTRWPAPFMIRSSASPWASTRTRASNTGTRSSSLPWMTRSGRGATFGAQATARSSRQLAGPRVDIGGERRVVDDADLPRVLEQALGVRRPVVEVGRRTEGGDAPDLRGRRPPRTGPARRRCRTRPATRP